MPAMKRAKRALAIGATIGTSLVALAAPAHADKTPGGGGGSVGSGTASGDSSGQDVSAEASGSIVKTDKHNNGTGASVGPLAPVGNWTPPACWYAPKYSAADFKKLEEHTWSLESTGYEWDAQQRRHYAEGHPYKDFNLAKADKGYWWTSDADKSYPPGWDSCTKPTFWVDNGSPPPADVPQAVTPEILAEIAYAAVRVPDTHVTLAPNGATKVNLPTWAWLDKTDFKPVSVRAYVPLTGMNATTTATPTSLKIEPGTPDAELYPGSGECTFNGDGSIGTPYVKGDADKTPPCGLTYLRASGSDGPYKLKATITWKISWTGTGQPTPKGLPDGTFGTTQDVTVDEIQAINR
ncbi:hypothetical protein OG210_11315 [Streptomyces sp. NBC_00466]|uniref:hypothetical protein n=1 Tax=Streptomyces sp. NBC_00466 TaxID=2903655 RepID=UPI0030DE1117